LQSLAARTCSAPPPGLIFRWAPPAAFPAGRPPASARDPSYYCPTGTGRWLVSCRGHFDLPRHLVVGHGALVTDRPATPNTDPGRGISFCWLLRQWQSYNYKLRVRAEGFVTLTVTGPDLFWCHWPLACQTDWSRTSWLAIRKAAVRKGKMYVRCTCLGGGGGALQRNVRPRCNTLHLFITFKKILAFVSSSIV